MAEVRPKAASPKTSSTSRARCARPAFRSGPGACSTRWRRVNVAHVGDREDFYWTLHAVFVKRHEHSILFDQAFRIFFRKRGYIEKLIASMLPEIAGDARRSRRRRARSASRRRCSAASTSARDKSEVEIDARLTVSDREVLQKKDFAQMTRGRDRRRQAGDRAAGAAARSGAHAAAWRRAGAGISIDIRRTLRASMKAGGAVIDLKYLGPREKEPPIVALLDISGSMSQYTRLFLHFLHAVTERASA